jgi:hypothetical protein
MIHLERLKIYFFIKKSSGLSLRIVVYNLGIEPVLFFAGMIVCLALFLRLPGSRDYFLLYQRAYDRLSCTDAGLSQ